MKNWFLKNKYNILKILLAIILLGVLVYYVGAKNILNILKEFNIIYLIPAAALLLLGYMLNAFNLYIMLTPLKLKNKFSEYFYQYSLSRAMGFISPSRIGDFSLPYFMAQKEYGKIFGIMIIDKMITIGVMSAFGIIGIEHYFGIVYFLICLVGFSVLAIMILMAFTNIKLRSFLSKKLGKYNKHFLGFYESITILLKKHLNLILINCILTIARLAVSAGIIYVLFMGLGFQLQFLDVFLIFNISFLTSFLPITINGFGFKELVVVLLYSRIGVESAAAFNVHIITFMESYVIILLIIAIMKIMKTSKKLIS